MGIYDRDYYRRSGPSYLSALGLSGEACKWLIVINVVVYILEFVTRGTGIPGAGLTIGRRDSLIMELFMLDPQRVLDGQVWRLLTYAFLHDTSVWQHIVFNMLFLWWFGSEVEQMYGTKEFLALYLLSAFCGGCAFTAWSLLTEPAVCIGASGAVTTVMVVFACHFPTRMILIFFILPVPVWLFVVFNVAQDAFIFLGGVRSTTAVTVHLAGAALGFAYYKSHIRLTGLMSSFGHWRAQQRRPNLRVVRPDDDVSEPVAVGAPPASPMDEQLEAKVDAVLEKVARHGQASLTDTERQILLRASELYKRRRS
jgi:membrane associated rhomboid family serine protease